MADLRNMTVGIAFRDEASAGINRVNSLMDSLASGFGGMGGLASSASSEMGNFGQVGSSALNSIAEGTDDVAGGLNHVSDSISDVGGGLNSLDGGSLNDMEDSASDVNGELDGVVESLSDVDNGLDNLSDNPLGDLTDDLGDADRAADDLNGNLDDLNGNLDDLNSGNIDDLVDDVDDLDDSLEDATDEAGDLTDELDNAGNVGQNAAGGLTSAFWKVAGALAAIFAVDKMKDLAIDMVEAAGEAEALNAQFETVFDTLQDDANEAIDAMAAEFGMLPSRLQPTLTKTTSMFKGFGMSTENAMEAAGKSLELAADAAAFYDVSMKDADGALTSFLKGNTNAAESIGVFATAAGMASFASEELGLDWKKLDEGSKQLVRMKYVETMQEAAGATGQAARESEGYENVLGNMQQAWVDLKIGLGDAIFDEAIAGMQGLTKWMTEIDVEPIVDGIENAIDVGIGFATAIKDNWGPVKETVIGIGVAVGTFAVIMGGLSIIGTINTLIAAYQAGTMAATLTQMGLNGAMLASPVTWVVAGIAALVGIGIALYRNWDTVTAKTKEVWESIGGLSGAIGLVLGPIGFLINAGIDLATNWDNTQTVWENVWGAIQRSAATSVNAVIGLINEMIGVINKIPGINIPIVAKVDWGQAEAGPPQGMAGISNAKPDGSHSTGLASVPYDNYLANLHRDESVLTAEQSNGLRSMGILQSAGGRPVINLPKGDDGPTDSPTVMSPTDSQEPVTPAGNVITKTENHNTFVFNISGENAKDIRAEVREEVEAIFRRLNAVTP